MPKPNHYRPGFIKTRSKRQRDYDPPGHAVYSRAFTPSTRKFIEEYLIDCNPSKAALRAGFKNADYGQTLLKNAKIVNAIEARMTGRADRVTVDQDFVLRRWLQLATADARELQGIWFVPCRHCWGIDHSYQFTDLELRDAITAHRREMLKLPEGDSRRVEFDERGGGGYTINKEPCRGSDWVERELQRHDAMGRDPPEDLKPTADHSCPACFGDGIMRPWVADTRNLSPSAATLFNGFKITKDGSLQIMMRDREHAEDMLAQHLGMLVQRNVNMNIDLFKLSEEQLNELLKQVTDSGLLTIDGESEVIDGGEK